METIRTSLRTAAQEDLAFQWQLDGVDLEDDGRFAGIDGPELTILHVARNTEGLYRCVVSRGEVFTTATWDVRLQLADPAPPAPRPASDRAVPPRDELHAARRRP